MKEYFDIKNIETAILVTIVLYIIKFLQNYLFGSEIILITNNPWALIILAMSTASLYLLIESLYKKAKSKLLGK